MAEQKRHHFVPQFYLRNFAIDERARRVGLFNIRRDQFVAATSIRSQAQRDKLYGNRGGEQALCELEGAASEIIRQAISKQSLPPPMTTQYSSLLVFALFQAYRTPSAGAEYANAIEKMVKLIASQDQRVAPHLSEFHVDVDNPVQQTLRIAAELHPVIMDLSAKLLVAPPQT